MSRKRSRKKRASQRTRKGGKKRRKSKRKRKSRRIKVVARRFTPYSGWSPPAVSRKVSAALKWISSRSKRMK